MADLANYVNPAHRAPGCTIRVLGMAPDASLVGPGVFPAGGFAFNSSILEALDYAVTHDRVDVINESFGSNQFPDTNDDPTAVFNEELVKAGIVVTASSGDAGDNNTIGSPASSPGIISVGGSTMFRSYAQTTGSGFQLSNGQYRGNSISALSSSGFTQPGRTIDPRLRVTSAWALCSTDVDIYQELLRQQGRAVPDPAVRRHQPVGAADRRGRAAWSSRRTGTATGASPTADLVRRLLTSNSPTTSACRPRCRVPACSTRWPRWKAARSVRQGPARPTANWWPAPTSSTCPPGPAARRPRTQVTNVGSRPQVVQSSVRTTTKRAGCDVRSVQFDRDSLPTFIDGFGITRTFTTTTFSVPRGGDHLAASIA